MLGAALALVSAPAAANPVNHGTYVEARFASEAGAEEEASRRFARLLAAEPDNQLIARRALEHGLRAGDFPLALTAARRLDAAGALSPLRRILLAGEAMRQRDWAAAKTQIDRMEQEQVLSLMVPALRAWASYGSGEGDPLAPLAAMEAGAMSGYAVEHRALIELARGRGEAVQFLALDPASGLRPQHLRLLAAAEFAERGDRQRALALVAGDQPALAAARARLEAGQKLPRLDTAAEGVAELLSRVALDFNRPDLAPEGILLARLASYLAPDSSQPLIIAAELLSERQPAAAAAVLERVPVADPFAGVARELRLRNLAGSGRSSQALQEAAARTARGSRDPFDWIQLGNLQADAGRHREAARTFERAHELWRAGSYPGISEWSLWLMRGGALEQGGDWPAARRALQEAHRLAPEEPAVLNYLGYAQVDRGENAEAAEQLIREAVRLEPNDAAIIDSLGWALFRRGKVDEAIPLLERAVKGEPADVEINEHLGDAYYAAGRRIEARFAWAAALVHAESDAATRLRGKIERGATPQRARP